MTPSELWLKSLLEEFWKCGPFGGRRQTVNPEKLSGSKEKNQKQTQT